MAGSSEAAGGRATEGHQARESLGFYSRWNEGSWQLLHKRQASDSGLKSTTLVASLKTDCGDGEEVRKPFGRSLSEPSQNSGKERAGLHCVLRAKGAANSRDRMFVSLFLCCWDKISKKKNNLREERFILVHGFSSWLASSTALGLRRGRT